TLLAPALNGAAAQGLVGQALPALVSADDRDTLLQQLGAVLSGAAGGSPRAFQLADGRPVSLVATLFRQQRASLLLVRLRAVGDVEPAREDIPLEAVLERIPDAFVLVDRNGIIRAVNAAFLDLTGVPRAEQATGEH
ncbi:MAG: PAS domain-containing protein, partial [Sandaracinobacter sp.]